MNKKQKNLLIRIIVAAVFFVPLYLISEDYVHVDLPQWAIIVLFLIPYLTVGYDIENLADPERRRRFKGQITTDYYGREVPKQAHGSMNLEGVTSSTRQITAAMLALFDRIVDRELLVRRMYVVANHVVNEAEALAEREARSVQLDMFTDYAALEREKAARDAQRLRERKQQRVVLEIKEKYGKNAILKGTDLEEGATQRERNNQVGGHRA